ENNSISWTYTSSVVRQANGATANQVDVVVGQPEVSVRLVVRNTVSNTSAGVSVEVGIAQDSTTTINDSANQIGGQVTLGGASTIYEVSASYNIQPAIGRHFYSWNEASAAVGTTTWNTNNAAATVPTGLQGWIEG